jgi:hypothetical protein
MGATSPRPKFPLRLSASRAYLFGAALTGWIKLPNEGGIDSEKEGPMDEIVLTMTVDATKTGGQIPRLVTTSGTSRTSSKRLKSAVSFRV